jgi:hypothetical protein
MDDRKLEIREAARARWVNDDLQIDEDAVVSLAEEGAWVAAWVWVPEEEIVS